MERFNRIDFIKEIRPTLGWLLRSIEATNLKGSSFSYSRFRRPFNPWFPAYPETTGYIIETLFDYSALVKEESINRYAYRCADWLMTIQSEVGAFNAFLIGEKKLSVFNTGMILFGLNRAAKESGSQKYKQAATKAVDWLIRELDDSNRWSSHAYVKDFYPTYYSRVIWAILAYASANDDFLLRERMKKCLVVLSDRFNTSALEFADWGFFPGTAAFTHTIAYTLRGFKESALLLGLTEVDEMVNKVLDKIMALYDKEGRLAGSYGSNWKSDNTFICLTGHAQMSILFSKRYRETSQVKYQNMAGRLLNDIQPYIRKGTIFKSLEGALPGSIPYSGAYLRFHHPNWAAKFYLDAKLAFASIHESSFD